MSTIEKALGLLEFFSSHRPEIGLTEFRRLTQVDKATLHRHLTALRDCGFLEQNLATKAYRLGPAILRLASVREATVPVAQTVSVYVDRLAAETTELVHASLPQAGGMSALAHCDGGIGGTRVGFDVAEILPFHATSSGLVMMAFGPPEIQKRSLSRSLERFTATTPISTDQVTALIQRTTQRGFAESNQAFENEVSSVAAPFFDQSGFACGAIAIATPSSRMSRVAQKRFACLLTEAAEALSRDLGGQVPINLSEIWDRLRAVPAPVSG